MDLSVCECVRACVVWPDRPFQAANLAHVGHAVRRAGAVATRPVWPTFAGHITRHRACKPYPCHELGCPSVCLAAARQFCLPGRDGLLGSVGENASVRNDLNTFYNGLCVTVFFAGFVAGVHPLSWRGSTEWEARSSASPPSPPPSPLRPAARRPHPRLPRPPPPPPPPRRPLQRRGSGPALSSGPCGRSLAPPPRLPACLRAQATPRTEMAFSTQIQVSYV